MDGDVKLDRFLDKRGVCWHNDQIFKGSSFVFFMNYTVFPRANYNYSFL